MIFILLEVCFSPLTDEVFDIKQIWLAQTLPFLLDQTYGFQLLHQLGSFLLGAAHCILDFLNGEYDVHTVFIIDPPVFTG